MLKRICDDAEAEHLRELAAFDFDAFLHPPPLRVWSPGEKIIARIPPMDDDADTPHIVN
jgi:hypothetical protein